MKTYYDTLGVTANSSQEEIRSAYYTLSKMVHPDKFDSKKEPREWAKATELQKEANCAFQILKDPVKRAEYDLTLNIPHIASNQNSTSSNSSNKSQRRPPNNQTKNADGSLEGLSIKFSHILESITSGKRKDVFQMETFNFSLALGVKVICVIIIGLFAYSTYGLRWSLGYTLFVYFSSIPLIWAFLILNFLEQDHLNLRFRPGKYLSTLYYIEISKSFFRFRWRGSLEKIFINTKYFWNNYSHTQISLKFPSEPSCTVKVYPQSKHIEFMRFYNSSIEVVDNLICEERWETLESLNDFAQITADDFKPIKIDKKYNYLWLRQFFSRKKRIPYLVTTPIIIIISFFLSNMLLDDMYSWNQSIKTSSISQYKFYIIGNHIGLYKSLAIDSAWAIANRLNTISSYDEIAKSDIFTKYQSKAREQISKIYDQSINAYLNQTGEDADTTAINTFTNLILRARNSGIRTVSVYYEGVNGIPDNLVTRIKRKTGLKFIEEIGNSFDAAHNLRREREIHSALVNSIRRVVPSDALTLKLTSDTSSDICVFYKILPSTDLYFAEKNKNFAPEERPYYPAIQYHWICFINNPDKSKNPYFLEVKSNPAEIFKDRYENVYQSMAISAFTDFEEKLTSKLGLALAGRNTLENKNK